MRLGLVADMVHGKVAQNDRLPRGGNSRIGPDSLGMFLNQHLSNLCKGDVRHFVCEVILILTLDFDFLTVYEADDIDAGVHHYAPAGTIPMTSAAAKARSPRAATV